MADRTVYVDGTTSGTPGTDGARYASLQAAVTGEVAAAGNLVSSSTVLSIECSLFAGDAADTTACTINGFTTDATHYVIVYAAPTSRHAGKWSDTEYRLSVANASALTISDDYVRLDGLQVEVSASNANSQQPISIATISATNNDIRLLNVIARSHANATFFSVVFAGNDADVNLTIINSVFHSRAGNGSDRVFSGSWASLFMYNCTLYGGAQAFRQVAGTSTLTNVVAVTAAGTDYLISAGTMTATYCVSRDTTVGAGTGNIPSTSIASMLFTDAANTDFHIGSGSSLQDVGTDLTAEGFTTDIDGETRTGSWDIGADEFVEEEEAPAVTDNRISMERPFNMTVSRGRM
jgi:hypothetical protein